MSINTFIIRVQPLLFGDIRAEVFEPEDTGNLCVAIEAEGSADESRLVLDHIEAEALYRWLGRVLNSSADVDAGQP